MGNKKAINHDKINSIKAVRFLTENQKQIIELIEIEANKKSIPPSEMEFILIQNGEINKNWLNDAVD